MCIVVAPGFAAEVAASPNSESNWRAYPHGKRYTFNFKGKLL